jgi:lysophospholipase L1-like esterase
VPVLACAWLCAAVAVAGDEYMQMRGGIDNFFVKMVRSARGDKAGNGPFPDEPVQVRVVYFGGSITAGAGASKPELCYRSLLTRHLKELYPQAKLQETDAALGGTGSWLGAFRAAQDVLGHWLPADLVIVEFAVNDGDSPEAQVKASMEGIVRQIRRRYPDSELLFVYTLVKGHLDAFKAGKLPERMVWHEEIAAHYQIPSVNMAQYAARKILAGELTIDEFAKDGVHPTDRGYGLYLEALKPYFARARETAEKATELVKHPLPQSFGKEAMENAKFVSYDKASFDEGWLGWQFSPVGNFQHVLASDKPGATVTLKFRGSQMGYFDVIGPDTGNLEFSVDGGAWQPKANWDPWCREYYRAHSRILVQGLDPAKEHELKLRISEQQPPESKGRWERIGQFLVDGDVIWEDPFKGLDPLQRIDALYASIPPVKYTPPADRWALLPKTMERLQNGGELRIVMLGDSIVNDTSSSRWELMLMRMYPKCKVVKVTSVRGSTGCWWYKDENRVEEYVLRHKPDLLMIGGISNKDDTDAIREVIRQVRAKIQPEILLMTGPFGFYDPVADKNWRPEPEAEGTSYRTRLMKLAQEEKAEFIDMQGVWGTYLRECGKPRLWYMRDVVHANDRGFQVLGRILERYFAPK